MKLRIRGNSIRLRLLQSEIKHLSDNGKVSEKIQFGLSDNEILKYTLQVSPKAGEVFVGFCRNEICITLPEKTAKDWIETEKVSLEFEKSLDNDSLKILIEKDFVCVTRKDDPDNLDAFPNSDLDC